MRTVKAATVALLFVLIPHQAPFAGSVESSRPSDEASPAAAAEVTSVKSEPQPRVEAGTPVDGELLVSAEPVSPSAEVSSRHLESQIDPDGYSWSVRSLR